MALRLISEISEYSWFEHVRELDVCRARLMLFRYSAFSKTQNKFKDIFQYVYSNLIQIEKRTLIFPIIFCRIIFTQRLFWRLET